MHSALLKKLKSRSGISMTVSLVFFLVCVAVSGIIITAATTSVGVAVNDRLDQRGYLAVASAARLVMTDLEDLRYDEVYSKDGGYTGSKLIPDDRSTTRRFVWDAGGAGVTLNPENTAVSYLLAFPALQDENIPEVKGEIVIGKDLSITVTLTDGDTMGTGANEMTIYYVPVLTQPVMTTTNTYSGAAENTSYIYTATVRWAEPTVTGMGAGA